MVFRPSDFDFPPARGRTSFEFLPGGVLRQGAPGPDDRRTSAAGTWAVDGDELTLYVDEQPQRRYRVAMVDDAKLVLNALE